MDNCVFCKIINKQIPSKIVYEDDIVIAFMDINPICDGHTLIVPKKHIENIFTVDDNTFLYMYKIAKELTPILEKATNESSMSYDINYGDAQAIKHIHLHLLPNVRQRPHRKVEDVYNRIIGVINEKKAIEKES
ncbi:MAG: HIT domain-containing protein [Mollicutes bacterium]|nr:HIT domain-containing protein [Mollicutes bacterium]